MQGTPSDGGQDSENDWGFERHSCRRSRGRRRHCRPRLERASWHEQRRGTRRPPRACTYVVYCDAAVQALRKYKRFPASVVAQMLARRAAATSLLRPAPLHVAAVLVRRSSTFNRWNAAWSVGWSGSCGCAVRTATPRSTVLRHLVWSTGGSARWLATRAGHGVPPADAQGLSVVGRTLLFLPACITLCLGAWQVSRLEWKYEQIELRHQLLSARPRRVASGEDVLACWDELTPQRGGTEFAPLTLRGRFEHDKEVYIGMRGKPGAVEEGLGAGYSVITPFVMEDRAGDSAQVVRVLVNRGWVPSNAKQQRSEERERAASRAGTALSSVVDLEVVIRKGEKGAS